MRPRRLARRVVYENPWVNLYLDKVRQPDGTLIERFHVLHYEHPSVGVVVTNSRGHVLFVKSYRYVTNSIGWEIPAGRVDKGETIIHAGQREVWEETGYRTTRPRLLYSYYPANGMSDKVFHLLSAQGGSREGTFDTNEVQKVAWFTPAQINRLIQRRQIQDGFTLLGLFMAGKAKPFVRTSNRKPIISNSKALRLKV